MRAAGTLLSHLPRRPGAVTFADTYHGKAVPLGAATRLVRVEQDLHLPQPERVIPYALARDIVLRDPDHIVALDCPCRASREHPCLPLDVCLIVGEPFASFTVEHHPGHARSISPDEAVEILQAEDARGHAHHAFFKDAMLGRFYAICNCCSCCCGAMHAHRGGTPMLASSGYLPRRCGGLRAASRGCRSAPSRSAIGRRVDEAECLGRVRRRCALGGLPPEPPPSAGAVAGSGADSAPTSAPRLTAAIRRATI